MCGYPARAFPQLSTAVWFRNLLEQDLSGSSGLQQWSVEVVMSKGFEKMSSLDSYKYKYFPCSGVPATNLLIQSKWSSISQI